jgi:acetyl-CoA/propionyl-CoA carboxylase biotin carboxyl carrier protein
MTIADSPGHRPVRPASPAVARPFGTVLVANRGEIACRIIETLARLGIRSVAVYSDADRGAKHVGLADIAVRIGPAAAQASYLDVEAIIAAAQQTGAEAIHPGYGFLSENAAFAAACAEAGIVFIGPSTHALEVMGDKIRAKKQVESFGVPTIPGVAEPGLDDAALIAAAPAVGYPLLIKPSAGGGGKGMQVVREASELHSGLAAARRVAASAFGDDTLFLERLVETPRHIEVQLLADGHGGVIHLGERECSLQRRHQKVIEEAPSPLLDAATRARIGEAACQVARSVDYAGAGTVEFLVAAAQPEEFFFMEMNTRLQVEHPVTELVTGIDLVEWQLRIAAGEPLGIAQSEVTLSGHAIEARVYAESPERGFLPTTGTVLALREAQGEGIRVDSALAPGLQIGADYDPMLAKVIAWGADRAQALTRLDAALEHTTVLGLHTNLEYLRALLAEPEVQAGDLDTGLIERSLDGLVFREPDDGILTAAALALHAERQVAAEDGSPWLKPSGWRLGSPRPVRYGFRLGPERVVDVFVTGGAHEASIAIESREHRARFQQRDASTLLVELDGVARTLRVARQGASVWIGDAGAAFELTILDEATRSAEHLAGLNRTPGQASPDIRTPMPGTVVAVSVASGKTVEVGESLLTVEAMKMEHRLTATIDGIVSIHVAVGDLVKSDQILASIDPAEAADPAPATPDEPEPTQSATARQEGAAS